MGWGSIPPYNYVLTNWKHKTCIRLTKNLKLVTPKLTLKIFPSQSKINKMISQIVENLHISLSFIGTVQHL
jgi:hypothetical protein